MLIGGSKLKTNLDMVRKIKGTLEKALSFQILQLSQSQS